MSTRRAVFQLLAIALTYFYPVLYQEAVHDSRYIYHLNILICNNTEYLHGCRHEIGHKMSVDMAMEGKSTKFSNAVSAFIYLEMKKDKPSDLAIFLILYPNMYQFGDWYQPMMEEYAAIYAWADGDISKIPELLRGFYSPDNYYKELYSCLVKRPGVNICDGSNISILEKQS